MAKDISAPAAPWQKCCFIYILFMLLTFTLKPLSPAHIYKLYSTLGYALTAALFIFYLYRAVFRRAAVKAPECVLMFAYLCWLLISRAANRLLGLGGGLELSLLLDMSVCFLLMIAATQLDERQRRMLLRFAAAFCSVYAALISSVMLFAMLTGTRIALPPEYVRFLLVGKSPEILSNNHNISAVWVYLGLCLSMYAAAGAKKPAAKALYILFAAVCFLMIALSLCRTVQFTVYMSAAMAAMVCVLTLMRGKKSLHIAPVFCLAACAALALSFFAVSRLPAAVSGISQKSIPAYAERYISKGGSAAPELFCLASELDGASAAPAQSADAAPAASPVDLTDKRDLVNDMKTFTERSFIWRSALDSVKARPAILLIGTGRDDLMELPNRFSRELYGIKRDHEHMHNFLVQTFMLSGLPGLLLVVGICALLVLRMIRLFFDGAAAVRTKLLIIPVSGLLLQGMLEAGLFTAVDMRAAYFFFLFGTVLKMYRIAYTK